MLNKNQAGCLNLWQTGWKHYNTIRKKAMEQEFSWSGLLISLSIAFFIVVISASALSFINHNIAINKTPQNSINKNIYYLESGLYLSSNVGQANRNSLT